MAMCDSGPNGSDGGGGGGLLESMAVVAKAKMRHAAKAGDFNSGNVSSGVEWTGIIKALLNATVAPAPGLTPGSHLSLEERVSELVFRVLEDVLGVDIRNPSPVTKNLPMVASPVPAILCIFLYVIVVWLWSSHLKNSGQKPRKQEPLALRWLVIAHNLFLCCLSLFMGVGLAVSAHRRGYSVWGNVCGADQSQEIELFIYVFYVSKLYEFMDTAIMLFRRNLRQVTFLHVYHHASITFVWWLLCLVCPSGDTYFPAAFNSCIHAVMYLYYLLAATVAKDERRRRKYLFWGKYLTILQMAQFISFMGQSAYGMLIPGIHTRGMPRLLFLYSLSLLACFANFFVKKYARPHKRSDKAD